ncbi:hypothetical protein PVL29_025831 [Vitis rotundifolia]|uniref:BAH domain-containing protein n=1 Tax=Vitis rotundifolia TaxID=103349 RepID=A0AA38YKY1_VITRO|nr:hypothetical protein PVL29_025831 [Vitis rotundifolia]
MSANGQCFVEWKEQFVSQERGHRVVHYFLKDSAGNFILAVVGTERSVRHMFYVVADEFLSAYGSENSVHAGFKWRSRREVVDWLTSMLSKQHLPGDGSESPSNDLTQGLGSSQFAMTGFGARRAHMPDYTGRFARNLEGHDSDIVWSGVAWTCGKQLKHYPSFCRNGTTIVIQSFVFVMAKEEDHYLAYLEDMYEDRKGQKKVRVRWFHHNQEVKGVIPLQNPHPKEVFITPCAQVISAECVDGPAIVLTPEHYEKCLAAFPHAFLSRVHLCFRQFRSHRVKPFDLSKLRGYFDQAILSCLDLNPLQKPNSDCYAPTAEEDEELSPGDNVKQGAKRTRSCRGRQRFVNDRSFARIPRRGSQMMMYESPRMNLKYDLSSRRLLSQKHVEPHPWPTPLFKVDEKIELLCQDSGIRGCWFRCTVLRICRKQMKVRYVDVQDEDGCGNLEEWTSIFRLAAPDKLGMRCLGRPTIRPAPSSTQIDVALKVGTPVDAWWSDGWWEGVITEANNLGDGPLQVYIPGENLFLNMHSKDLRISRDWVGNQWVDIEPKPDILSAIYAAISPDAKISTSLISSKDAAVLCPKAPTSTMQNVVEDKLGLAAPVSSYGFFPEDMDCVNEMKQPSREDGGGGNDADHVNDSHNNDNLDEALGDDNDENNNNDEDDHNDGDDNDCELDLEDFETAPQKCVAVELMEVVA